MYLQLTESGISFKYKSQQDTSSQSYISHDDFITHVDNIPVISAADISNVFTGNIKEFIIPIVDDEDLLETTSSTGVNAMKLKGFVTLKIHTPNKVTMKSLNDHVEKKSADTAATATSSVHETVQPKGNTAATNDDHINRMRVEALKTAAATTSTANTNTQTQDTSKVINDGNAKPASNEKSAEEVNASASASSKTIEEELYGPGKRYPVPFNAGSTPRDFGQNKYHSNAMSKPFVYAVRFRSGPIGIAFDNKLPNKTKIGKSQSQLSQSVAFL